MTPELWQRVCQIFEQVVEMPPAQRAEFLRELRQSDGEVGAQVEVLLGATRGQKDGGQNTEAESLPSVPLLECPPDQIWDALAASATSISVNQPGKEWPATIGPYAIEGELARGGMGIVLRATDPKFARSLAIKILDRRHQNDGSLGQRFLEEALITGQLQHPGIPPVYDMGRLPDGRPFLAMKLIHGRTLAELLKTTHQWRAASDSPPASRHSPLATRFIDVFDQICQTMAYAHTCKVIHRDLKPSNIMVGAFGEVQVMDWGLAKRKTEDEGRKDEEEVMSSVFRLPPSALASETQPGSVMGSPAYIAPEQARGEVENLDERCDVFGLGAILCEILTGQPPFPAENSRESLHLASVGDVSAAFARLEFPGVDPALAALAKHCLAPERNDRPRDAGAVATALGEYREALQERLKKAEIEQAAAQARAEAEQAKAREERRRRNATRALAALSIVFVLAVSGAVLWFFQNKANLEADKNRKALERLTAEITLMLDKEESEAKDLKRQLDNYKEAYSLLSDLERWHALLIKRDAALRSVQALFDSSGGQLDRAISDRKQTRRQQYESDLNDFNMARELDEIQMKSYMHVQANLSPAWSGNMYDTILSKKPFDIDVRKSDPKAAAEIIKNSNLRYVLVAMLDHWAEMSQYPDSKYRDQFPRLLEIARLADDFNAWRDRFRRPEAWQDNETLQQLAREIHAEEHSPQLLIALAKQLDRLARPLDRQISSGQSVAVMQKALFCFPQNFWLNLTMPYFLDDDREKAAYCQAARALRPDNSVTCGNLGLYLLNQKEKDPAIHKLIQATAIDALVQGTKFDAQNFIAWYNLGRGWRIVGNQREKAVLAYQKAYDIATAQSNDPEVFENLGNELLNLTEFAAAADAFQQALKLNSNKVSALRNLGVALSAQKKYDAAIKVLRQAIDLAPTDGPSQASLGYALLSAERFEDGRQAIQTALKRVPERDWMWFKLNDLLAMCDSRKAVPFPEDLRIPERPRGS